VADSQGPASLHILLPVPLTVCLQTPCLEWEGLVSG
jgi:hypothetical protein